VTDADRAPQRTDAAENGTGILSGAKGARLEAGGRRPTGTQVTEKGMPS